MRPLVLGARGSSLFVKLPHHVYQPESHLGVSAELRRGSPAEVLRAVHRRLERASVGEVGDGLGRRRRREQRVHDSCCVFTPAAQRRVMKRVASHVVHARGVSPAFEDLADDTEPTARARLHQRRASVSVDDIDRPAAVDNAFDNVGVSGFRRDTNRRGSRVIALVRVLPRAQPVRHTHRVATRGVLVHVTAVERARGGFVGLAVAPIKFTCARFAVATDHPAIPFDRVRSLVRGRRELRGAARVSPSSPGARALVPPAPARAHRATRISRLPKVLQMRRKIKRRVVRWRGRRGLHSYGVRRIDTPDEVPGRVGEQGHQVRGFQRVRVVHRFTPAKTLRINVGSVAYQGDGACVVPPARGGVQRGEPFIVPRVHPAAAAPDQLVYHVHKGRRRYLRDVFVG